MFNDQILNIEYIRYLKGEVKHHQENIDKCLKYMKLNENNNNTLGYVYSTIFLENAKCIKEIENQIEKLQAKDKERKNNDK